MQLSYTFYNFLEPKNDRRPELPGLLISPSISFATYHYMTFVSIAKCDKENQRLAASKASSNSKSKPNVTEAEAQKRKYIQAQEQDLQPKKGGQQSALVVSGQPLFLY